MEEEKEYDKEEEIKEAINRIIETLRIQQILGWNPMKVFYKKNDGNKTKQQGKRRNYRKRVLRCVLPSL